MTEYCFVKKKNENIIKLLNQKPIVLHNYSRHSNIPFPIWNLKIIQITSKLYWRFSNKLLTICLKFQFNYHINETQKKATKEYHLYNKVYRYTKVITTIMYECKWESRNKSSFFTYEHIKSVRPYSVDRIPCLFKYIKKEENNTRITAHEPKTRLIWFHNDHQKRYK